MTQLPYYKLSNGSYFMPYYLKKSNYLELTIAKTAIHLNLCAHLNVMWTNHVQHVHEKYLKRHYYLYHNKIFQAIQCTQVAHFIELPESNLNSYYLLFHVAAQQGCHFRNNPHKSATLDSCFHLFFLYMSPNLTYDGEIF